jgi:arginine/ornithine N-succinyltransferase beta subunit
MEADWLRVARTNGADGPMMMMAAGVMHDFVACYGHATKTDNGELLIEPKSMEMLGIGPGDRILAVSR